MLVGMTIRHRKIMGNAGYCGRSCIYVCGGSSISVKFLLTQVRNYCTMWVFVRLTEVELTT